MWRALALLCLVCCAVAGDTLVTAGPFSLIYNVSYGEPTQWYVNDHTIILGPGNTWHLIGITHTEPQDPIFEVNLAHATLTSKSISPSSAFAKQPFALGTYRTEPWQETHLWAPHIVLEQGVYYMFYCAGGVNQNDTVYSINVATSTDLWSWERVAALFQDGWDARDPMVINLGPAYNNTWALYYTATTPNSGAATVRHVNYVRLSSDLLNWGPPAIAFDGGVTGSPYGGPTESPFVVRRGGSFYLFNGAWSGYSDTRVWHSTNPLWFGNVTANTAEQVGEIPSHALEVVRDVSGAWYVTHCGWGQGGVFLAQIKWLDDLDNATTTLPPPVSPPALPPQFYAPTEMQTLSLTADSQWVLTPGGLQGGSALGDSFAMSSLNATSFTFTCRVTLTTTDGNPSSTPGPWTRDGTAAALVFRANDRYNPAAGTYAVNLFTNDGGGVKLFAFPYRQLAVYAYPIAPTVPYLLSVTASGARLSVAFAPLGAPLQTVISVTDSSYAAGFLGFNVWQGSALFQDVTVE